jgi:hypothetical protein
MSDKIRKMVCTTCGSDNVVRNADVAWNPKTGEWDKIVAVFDSFDCEDCGGECSIKEIEVDFDECLVNSDGCLIENDGDAETNMENRA